MKAMPFYTRECRLSEVGESVVVVVVVVVIYCHIVGVSENDVPKPEKLPDHTFEIHHDRRRSFFIRATSREEKDTWVEMFKSCCHRSKGHASVVQT